MSLPAKGEKLQLGDISQINADARTARRPSSGWPPTRPRRPCSQLVMWRVGRASTGRRSPSSRRLGQPPRADPGAASSSTGSTPCPTPRPATILFEVDGADEPAKGPARGDHEPSSRARRSWASRPKLGIPDRPEGPAVACRVRLSGGEATCRSQQRRHGGEVGPLRQVHPAGGRPTASSTPRSSATPWPRACSAGWSGPSSAAGPQVKGKPTYQVRIENASPLILNGLAVLGTGDAEGEAPKELSGICVAPRRSMTVPATEEVVKALGLRKGIRVVAADLSGL